MLKQKPFEKINKNIDLFKTETDEQKIEYMDYLKQHRIVSLIHLRKSNVNLHIG
jgi:hypothetical protein